MDGLNEVLAAIPRMGPIVVRPPALTECGTTTKPTEVGYYWYREPGRTPMIAELKKQKEGGELYFTFTAGPGVWPYDRIPADAEWWGPLQPPV